ncbi:hypothetical protein EKO04_006737 [Ascochyta lentis]|uniref:Uncharacterized protein n=1 Tax=Ascochyta lentis TaxID=205686 RepID=A0A8H7IYE0_9PLEO|nr:hypothetical protein EKO04_006737 [Ascochyta lentis]
MPIALTYDEALLFHHFTTHLGRWLDCTNASRVFALIVSDKARECPILCHAVLCFAARHRRDEAVADAAYERCVSLLIDRLNDDSTSYDEMLLSAVLLLHFADQLNVQSRAGSRDKHHLKGTSSILHASRKSPFVDPSATTLGDAAFWVYVRQCLYNATISQEPLDIDFSLQLQPAPDSIHDSHPLTWLRSETAWANQILWHTACIANFCFAGTTAQSETPSRIQQWQELQERIQTWLKKRPSAFDPIGSGPTSDDHVFSDIWFTADWHVVSHVFYHFSWILLLRYKPDSKFTTRWVPAQPSLSDRKILDHARAICAASEQEEVIRLLRAFEEMHTWRTTWIVEALKAEWGAD